MEKQLLQAALLQARADDEPDEGKAKALVNRVLKIKEDVTRAATARASSMSDQEERAVLLSSLKALQRGDSEKASKILEERLKKLSRRIEHADSDDEGGSPAQEAQVTQSSGQSSDDAIDDTSPDRWAQIAEGVLHVTDFANEDSTTVGDNTADPAESIDTLWPEAAQYKTQLESRGFILANGVAPAEPLCAPLLKVSAAT
jgi:hypothetical protein